MTLLHIAKRHATLATVLAWLICGGQPAVCESTVEAPSTEATIAVPQQQPANSNSKSNKSSKRLFLWKTPIGSPVPLLSSSPAVADGMLYMGSSDGNVYALDTRNGAIKWKLKTQKAIISSPAVTQIGVCIGSQDGNLYLLE